MNNHHVERLERLRTNLANVIRGKDECIEAVTIALIAGGSVLMEDVPGVGKTTLAKALARSVDATFHRIQFTPDLLPADILGSSIYNPVDGSFRFSEGPSSATCCWPTRSTGRRRGRSRRCWKR
jgi:MoxR-like ATPase